MDIRAQAANSSQDVIRWFQSLTPEQRLAYTEDCVEFAVEVCRRNGIDPWAQAEGRDCLNVETVALPRLRRT